MKKIIYISLLAITSFAFKNAPKLAIIGITITSELKGQSIYTGGALNVADTIWSVYNTDDFSKRMIECHYYNNTNLNYVSVRAKNMKFDSLNLRRNDGTPISILWTDNSGNVKRSLISSIPSSSDVYNAGMGLTKAGSSSPYTFAVDTNFSTSGNNAIMYVGKANSSITQLNSSINGKQNQLNGNGYVKANGTTITYDNSTFITGNQNITLTGDVTGSGATSIGTTLSNTGISAGKYDWVTVDAKGRATSGGNMTTPAAMSAKSLNTAYQVSNSVYSKIWVSANISCNLTLLAGQSGSIVLEISANGTTGWIYMGQIDGSNTGALTVGLNTTQITGGQLTADLPIGYYWRLRTVNNTGTPTFTWNGGNSITY